MKIVITVEQLDPNKGYLEYYLAKELTKLGHNVCVFTFGWSKSVLRAMLKEGFEVISVPHIAVVNKYHMPTPSGAAYVVKFVKEEKTDIVHCQPLFSPLSLFFIAFKGLFNYRIVGSLASQKFSIDNPAKKLMYYLARITTEKYVKSRSETIFVKSSELLEQLYELFNVQRQKFCIIPLGADAELFKFDAKARKEVRDLLGLHNDDVVVVYSGKITPQKDLDFLIEALAPLIARNPKVKLLIVGGGESSYIEYMRGLISTLEISKKVFFHQWVHRTRLPAFYSASDIAVWPGSSSISIVEAASVGLPVVIARSPVEIYAIENGNGFAFERKNISELREYLRILIHNEKMRKDMGRKSRLLVEQKLNWRAITLQYLDAYTRLQ